MMKKTLIIGIAFLIVGIFVGNYIYNNNTEKLESTFASGKNYYFIQEGVYSSKEIMEESIKDINIKVVDFENNKYYVYLGITRDYEIAEKIKNLYSKDGYTLYIKERTITNEEFYNNVSQFDLLIKNAETKDEILTIEEVVLANYEEILKK